MNSSRIIFILIYTIILLFPSSISAQEIITDSTVVLKKGIYKSFEEFKESFTTFSENEHLKSMHANLDKATLTELSGDIAIEGSTIFKREENFRHTMIYGTSGYPAYGIFNPFAWHKFVKDWKSGALKNKKSNNFFMNFINVN